MDLFLIFTSFFLATTLHFGIQKLFIYYKRFDNFNHRSSHKTLATRSGGIGIFLTLLSISLYFYFQGVELFDYKLFIPFGIMFSIGVYDDLYDADFKLKFFLQIIVAKILIDQGYVISNYHGLLGIYEIPWIFSQITTIIVFLIIVNAFNFIDGIDGLAITEFIKIVFLFEYFSENSSIFILVILVMCSIIPLFYFNFKEKKKVFLGDSGSLLLGTIASLYIFIVLKEDFTFSNNFNLNKPLFVISVLFYPIFDLIRVFVLRLWAGKSPFKADQNHIHHLLIKKFSTYKSILIVQLCHLFLFIIITK